MTKEEIILMMEKVDSRLFKLKRERNWIDNQITNLEEERKYLVEAEEKIG